MPNEDECAEREEGLTHQLVDHILWVVNDSDDEQYSSLVKEKDRASKNGLLILLPLQIHALQECTVLLDELFIVPALSLSTVQDHEDHREDGHTEAEGI